MLKQDEKFMQRAIELARLGRATVSPNPVVGCVIVESDQIIGEGWHKEAGKPHAEVNAVNSVTNPDDLKQSTAYVTLEPCAHYGKTPPCADMLVEKQIKRVVVGCTDPNPLVAGKGIKKLQENGVEVVVGCLEEDCLALNEIFFYAIQNKRPYVILKWAQTADNFIARSNFDSKWISNSQSRQVVHKWRSEIDAILVGKNTAKYDNPSLTTRNWSGKNPVRVVVDHQMKLNPSLNLFDESSETIVYNLSTNARNDRISFIQLAENDFLTTMLSDLNKKNIRSLLVEGGASTIQQFINLDLWNEARVFSSSVSFGEGISAPQLNNAVLVENKSIRNDQLSIYKRKL